jgi:hypothetical protein
MGRSGSPDIGGLIVMLIAVEAIVTYITGDFAGWIPLALAILVGAWFVREFIR